LPFECNLQRYNEGEAHLLFEKTYGTADHPTFESVAGLCALNQVDP
jgi:hypothetical protein